MSEIPLVDRHIYRREGTSRAAAEAIEPHRVTLRERVYRHIAQAGGATDEEIADALELAGNTERPRRRELEDEGRIIDSGERRPTKSGRSAIVWIPTPQRGQLPLL